jgi:hypothetical protein
LGLLVAAAAVSGCASTTFVSSWKEPLDGPLEFDGKRVAAVVVSPNESVRRTGEDALAREISKGRAQGVASYTIVGTGKLEDQEAAKKALADAKIEGAVVMRVVSSEKEMSYSPGTAWYGAPYYGSFYGYWGYGWGAVYDPGYLRTDTVVMVETLIYSLAQDKLVWAGHSKTTNPSDVTKFIQELSKAARKEMKKAGFID